MDARLIHQYEAQRTAASQTVASALAPRSRTQTSGTSGVFRAATTKSAPVTTAKAASTTSTSSGTSAAAGANTSDITSSDFLTLLVSELQNQDPTQPVDPNEYITQLAQVNSLEQLININTGIATLDSAVGTTSTGTTTPATGSARPVTGAPGA